MSWCFTIWRTSGARRWHRRWQRRWGRSGRRRDVGALRDPNDFRRCSRAEGWSFCREKASPITSCRCLFAFQRLEDADVQEQSLQSAYVTTGAPRSAFACQTIATDVPPECLPCLTCKHLGTCGLRAVVMLLN